MSEDRMIVKKALKKVHLVNWYGFIDEVVPIDDDLTLITGENECGKSTILDAIKYAYTGDTIFNKSSAGASQGIGKRDIPSYTRCLIDASAGIYARPADRIPVVFSHIAMEYRDELEDKSFVLGVIIETGAEDVRGNYWYGIDGMTIDRLSLVYEQDGVKKPHDSVSFEKAYKIPLYGKKQGIEFFMQMVGLRLPFNEVSRYQRKLRNILTYNPNAKIREFIRESVLEEHDINFDKLRDAKNSIDEITRRLDLIKHEIADLDDILTKFSDMDRLETRLFINKIKLVYRDLRTYADECEALRGEIGQTEREMSVLSEEIEGLEVRQRDVDDLYITASRELQESDMARAIVTTESEVQRLRDDVSGLEDICRSIAEFEDSVRSVRALLMEQNSGSDGVEPDGVDRSDGAGQGGESRSDSADRGDGGDRSVSADQAGAYADLSLPAEVSLTSDQTDTALKTGYIQAMRSHIMSVRDENIGIKALLSQKLYHVDEELRHEKDVIVACDKNKTDYSYASDQMALINEINKTFDKEGIEERAHMAFEYVVALKDESWRDAIEAFLGRHRFAILVEPEFFDIADSILDSSKYRYVELINTGRLMKGRREPVENSVFEKLEIRNEVAAAYFSYWLGGIVATTKEDVKNHDSAMSKEGKLSRNMAVTYIRTRKLKTYCLGSEAIALNRKKAEKRIEKLSAEKEELLLEEASVNSFSEKLTEALSEFRDYDFGAPEKLREKTAELKRREDELKELKEAQKNNAEYIALSERVSKLRDEINAIRNEKAIKDKELATKDGKLLTCKERLIEKTTKLDRKQEEFDGYKDSRPSAAETAVKEYDSFLSGEGSGDVIKPVTLERNERDLNRIKREVEVAQIAYNNRRSEADQLAVGLDKEAVYLRRREKIWVDDLQQIQEKLKSQTDRYEDIFKREFVLTIYEMAKDARRDIGEINKELRKLKFETMYRFDVRFLNDQTDFAKILRYAEFLQETGDMGAGQRTITEAFGYDTQDVERHEKEIRAIINRLIDQDDTREIQKYADYRNYMSYEIIINKEGVKEGKLSRQMGFDSGAGTQIPYTLILSASLSMLYNVRSNSARLVFIDEPFEKMSDTNIRRMLEFFRSQEFQVIFCAPPNKLESIGEECGVIIPVLKIKNEDMRIGKVRFKG